MEKGSKQSYHLLIITTTGARNNAGTSAHVFFTLCDEFGETNPRILYDPVGPVFDRDQINAFKVTMDRPLGEVECLRIWHDNEGKIHFATHIFVYSHSSGKEFYLSCMVAKFRTQRC